MPELQEAYKADSMLGDPCDQATPSHKNLCARNGLWYKDHAIVVPDTPGIKRQIMTELHDSQYAGHGGEYKTVQLVKRYFWWPHLDRDVRQFVKGCILCQRNKASSRAYAGKLQQHDLPTAKWQQVTMDFISNLPMTKHGNTMIMVVVDNLTKMAHFVPCPASIDAEGVNTTLPHCMCSTSLDCMAGQKRSSRTGTAGFWMHSGITCASRWVLDTLRTAHHHKTAAQAECMNRVLEETLRHFVTDEMDIWNDLLAAAKFSVDNSYQQSIGYTPFHLK